MPQASVKRLIETKKENLIDLVLDIEKYPSFIPYCINSKVYEQNQKTLGSFNYYLGWYGKAPAGREELNNLNYSKILIFHSIHK